MNGSKCVREKGDNYLYNKSNMIIYYDVVRKKEIVFVTTRVWSKIMIPDFDSNGNLPPGIVVTNVDEIKERCVLNFTDSPTRARIFDGYINYCRELISFNICPKQWFNGSYTTNKNDPADIDIVNHLDANKVDELDEIGQENFWRLTEKTRVKSEYMCDLLASIIVYPSESADLYVSSLKEIEFWLKYLGHDRNNNPKGIIEIDLSNTISYIDNYHREDSHE